MLSSLFLLIVGNRLGTRGKGKGKMEKRPSWFNHGGLFVLSVLFRYIFLLYLFLSEGNFRS